MVAHAETLTMQDIADLAHVQRHVVSMWRKRPTVRGVAIPFPSPVSVDGGVERFDRERIVEYLIATARGKNAEAGADAPAVSAPDGFTVDDVVVLLCLHALTGDELEGSSAADLVTAAERVDDGDRVVLREVRAMRPTPGLLRYVDDLVEASYGLPDALDRLMKGRLQRAAAERGLSDGVIELVGSLVEAARLSVDADAVALERPADLRIDRTVVMGFAGVRPGAGPDERSLRRRAVLDGMEVVDSALPTVRVLSVVGMPEAAALQAVDELTVLLAPTDVGVVIGSAAVLCDPLTGDGGRDRAHTLRSGNLALAVRLPRGSWKGAHRQSQALWVLRGTAGASSVWLADLDTETLQLDDLANDTVAALQGTERRAYRYARRAELAAVLAAAAVVPRGVRATQMAVIEASTRLDRIYAASLTTSEVIVGYDVPVAPAPAQIVLRRRSLGELHAARQLVVHRGSRIRAEHADAAGTIEVLSADGSADALRLDPFDAQRHYPRATRTEPGDVVFMEGRRPLARVDPRGGALVASPSRILRLREGGPIGPHALAAIINEMAPEGSEWQTWIVPDLPPEESGSLDAALADAAEHKEVLRRHDQALRDLVTNLIQGVAAGAVTLDQRVTTMEEGRRATT